MLTFSISISLSLFSLFYIADATANDYSSRFAVRGYPTIYWVPKNNKQNPVKYESGREVDDIIKWVEEHRTDSDKEEL